MQKTNPESNVRLSSFVPSKAAVYVRPSTNYHLNLLVIYSSGKSGELIKKRVLPNFYVGHGQMAALMTQRRICIGKLVFKVFGRTFSGLFARPINFIKRPTIHQKNDSANLEQVGQRLTQVSTNQTKQIRIDFRVFGMVQVNRVCQNHWSQSSKPL